MSAVPKPKQAHSAPRSIRAENLAVTLLAAAATHDLNSKVTKRWPERDVALIALLLCVTGIRLSEATALNLHSISGAARARRLQVTGKGKRDRTIPIQPALEQLIDAYQHTRRDRHGHDTLKDPTPRCWCTTTTPGSHPAGCSTSSSRSTPVRGCAPRSRRRAVHAPRHSFASIAIAYGTDVIELRDLLGHASLATTSRYLDAEASRLREAVTAHPSQRALDHLSTLTTPLPPPKDAPRQGHRDR